jgi:hypothetical protein
VPNLEVIAAKSPENQATFSCRIGVCLVVGGKRSSAFYRTSAFYNPATVSFACSVVKCSILSSRGPVVVALRGTWLSPTFMVVQDLDRKQDVTSLTAKAGFVAAQPVKGKPGAI